MALSLATHHGSLLSKVTTDVSSPSSGGSSDWALLELNEEKYNRNDSIKTNSREPTVIEGIVSEHDLVTGEVWIVVGRSGVQSGILNSSSATITLRKVEFAVRQIYLPNGSLSNLPLP